ncbi:integral membrane protein [Cladophialophora carrionii]|uniref:Integral membrane protein n=1 Tax=Cladophialophora carrionii TaxID=86049 RepID=A0A1C1CAU3_9EURO|nr:integral membrane protein [Cladophialophora carrionii]
MPRNTSFLPSSEPLRNDDSLVLQSRHTTGALSFLHPTHAVFRLRDLQTTEKSLSTNESDDSKAALEAHTIASSNDQLAHDVHFAWRSRDDRKGRHLLQYKPAVQGDSTSPLYIVPKKSASVTETLKGIKFMLTCFRYWDISYLVAITFFIASATWILNSFFLWLPLEVPESTFSGEIVVGGGVSAFVGATLFQLGSILLMIEAFNAERVGCFGWQVEKLVSKQGGRDMVRISPNLQHCEHHHNDKSGIGKGRGNGQEWQWFPSWNTIRSHCLREIGFLASFAMFCGTTVFWISGFVALPGVIDHMSQGTLNGLYWVPQIVGSIGFTVSGLLYMLETQPNWFTPSPNILGWHVGLWNGIGGIGFVLCGSLGPAYGNSGAQYQSALANFWGGWAFLIGSTLQWYESLDKNPVEEQ